MVCPNCGTQIAQGNPTVPNDGKDYTPISMWGYFGYEILFSIPAVGFIILLVFALGGTKNVNKRNFARSYFCCIILAIIIIAVLVLIGALTNLDIASIFTNR